MRPIIFAQIVSSLLIGAATATPTNGYASGELELRSSDLIEACSDHDLHIEDKYCAGEECDSNKLRLAKRCQPCDHKKGSNNSGCIQHETIGHKEAKCESKKSCGVRRTECHGKEKCEEKKTECHGKEKCEEKKTECHGKEKCEEKKKLECHGDKCDAHTVSKETFRGYRCSGQLYVESNVQEAAKKGCELAKNKQKKNGYPMVYLSGADEETKALERFHATGKYYVYPLADKKHYKFGPRESSMVLFDEECKVAGAVVRKKSNPCPTATWCFAQFYKKPSVHYTSCDQDHRQ